MFRILTIIVIVALASSARADESAYALVIGNNQPPSGRQQAELPVLQYADDDAVRYYQFFDRFAIRTILLAVLDQDTQRRYPGVATIAEPPSEANLRQAVDQLAEAISRDRQAGKKPVFYFAFSGHGAVSADGQAFLALLDGGINQETLYQQVIGKLHADYSHLMIDACHAGAVVGTRGMFDREVEAKRVPVSQSEILKLVESSGTGRFPGLGVIVATTADQEAHEWSRIQSGVFTHELLSGLTGPADVNADGLIEYSEIHAFVASANREIKDPRAIPQVVARAPQRNQNAPLIVLESLSKTRLLNGDPSRLGHFYIELENGQRYLDANLGGLKATAIVLPSHLRAFLRTADSEAEIKPGPDNRKEIASLEFTSRQVATKGSIDAAYREALFASAYGVTYYKGFVDSVGTVSVRFEEEHPAVSASLEREPAYKKPLSITCMGVAGASAVASIVTGVLAVRAKKDFDDTTLQRPAHEANQRYIDYGTASVVTGLAAVASGIAAWLLWPDEENATPVSVTPMPAGSPGLQIGISF